MEYIKSKDFNQGAEDLATDITLALRDGKKVLWILTGGSTIPSSVVALNLIKEGVNDLSNLTVTLTDERYGEVGHPDSSWQKLIDAGFDFDSLNQVPVLTGLRFSETARDFESKIEDLFSDNDLIIAQFGVGSDIHIAGIIPNSEATREVGLVSSYATFDFNRITLSFEAIKRIDRAYVFIFGPSKEGVVEELKSSKESLANKPANILKDIALVKVYYDR